MIKQASLLIILAVSLGTAATAAAAWDPNTDPDLVAWWPFNEGSGTVAGDSSGNNNNGALNGGAQWATGRFDDALQFNGSTSYVRAPHIPLDSRSFTIMLWIKPVLSASAVVFSTGLTGADNTDMHFRLGGPSSSDAPVRGVRMGFYNNDLDSPTGLIKDNEWSHLAFWYDYEHRDRRIYFNGVQKAGAAANPYLGTTGDTIIGYWPTGGQYYRGMVDDVRIYKRALTAVEIKSLVPPRLKAIDPSPADGATGVAVAVLSWTKGENALTHNIYIGTDPAALTKQVNPMPTAVMFMFLNTVPGTTYYWRVDEVAKDKTIATGDVWKFTAAPLTAYAPSPRNGDKWIATDTVISWQTGQLSTEHQMYFSTDKAAVENRDATASKGDQPGMYFPPAALSENTTYYWAVDEISASGKNVGELWKFTTIGGAVGVEAEYFQNTTLSGIPFLTQLEPDINHNWGNAGPTDTVVDTFSARWTADLEILFADTYTFIASSDDGVRLWLNGVQLVNDWVDRGTTDSYSPPQQLEPGIYSLVMEYYENGGGAVAQLSWQTPTMARQIIPSGPLQPPVRAKPVYPQNRDVNVPQDLTLMWSAGGDAVTHDVYFGEDEAAVAAATPADTAIYKGSRKLEENTLKTGGLEWSKTYYWRVDEVNTASADSPWKGAVWSFTTANFLVVDDFESYTDDDIGRIFQSWIDGWGYTTPEPGNKGNGTGSTVGYIDPPYAERTVVHSGKQAMPLAYNNADSSLAKPYYSEAERTFDSPQDWTSHGMNTLSLWVHGYPAAPNDVTVTETGGKMTLTGGGTDIWNASDDFTFAFKNLTGDATIVAKVASVGTGSNTWAKGGVMIRDSLDGGAMDAYMVMTGSAGNGASFGNRPVAHAAYPASVDSVAVIAPPYWVKLERVGNMFTGYASADGSAWLTTFGPAEVIMADPVNIGICVTSHAGAEQRTFEFEGIQTTGKVTGAWQGAVISSPYYNSPQDLYVAIQDSTSKIAVVKDATAVNGNGWVQVKMPLSSFTTASPSKVTKMFIGVGNRTNPVADGTGMLFIDDIRVIKE